MKHSKSFGLITILLTYIIAAAIGIIIFKIFEGENIYIRILLADIIATIVVYLIGSVLKNSSVYDPYWSIQPIVILISATVFYGGFNFGIFMILTAVCYWGIRLTVNWAISFKNLNTQDWRYDNYKHNYPKLFFLINLLGIHLFPTIVVYLVLLPAIAFIQNSAVNMMTLLGFFLCILSATLQLIADKQMQQFRRERVSKDELINTGLWKYARHPNYLGEIIMWWGIYIMMLSVVPDKWLFGIGALINTMMFIFISIPMADKRNSKKPGFAEYVNTTRCLLPIKKSFITNPLNEEETYKNIL